MPIEERRICTRCKRTILDKVVVWSGEAYHQTCFKCFTCSALLYVREVIEKDNKIYCKFHVPFVPEPEGPNINKEMLHEKLIQRSLGTFHDGKHCLTHPETVPFACNRCQELKRTCVECRECVGEVSPNALCYGCKKITYFCLLCIDENLKLDPSFFIESQPCSRSCGN